MRSAAVKDRRLVLSDLRQCGALTEPLEVNDRLLHVTMLLPVSALKRRH